MAVADQFETVQKLYIAFYQRPADFAGRQYWAEQVEAQGLQSVINAFATSAEATALYGEINNETIGDVIDAIYQAAFGRAADAEGKAWYVAEFEAGNFTAATIALNVVNGAAGVDATTLGNKVDAADLFTAAVENVEYNEADIATARDFLAGVTTTVPTQAEVDAVVEQVGGEGEVSELNAALIELQAAEQARVEFLQGALDNEAVAAEAESIAAGTEPTQAEIATAIGTVASDAAGTVASLAKAASENESVDYSASFANASAAVRASMISEVRAVLEQAVAEEQADVNAVSGLSSAITSLNAAKNAYAAAATTEAAADVNLDGEIARFDALNATASVVETTSPAYGLTVTVTGTNAATYNIALSGRTLEVPAELKALNLVGLDAVVQAAQSFYNASLATTNAENSLASAVAKALNLEGDLTGNSALTAADVLAGTGYYTDPVDTDGDGDLDVDLGAQFANTDIEDLIAAQDDLAAFNSAVEAYTAAQQLAVSLSERNDAITAAQGAIEDLDYVIGSTAGSVDNDVFVFADANMDISGFGAQGDDVLFLGEGFTRVDLGGSVNLNGSAQGDASVLEVFFQQDGVDAKIYVEGAAFAGSATNGFQGSVITLTGVAVEDLSLSADGFITVAA